MTAPQDCRADIAPLGPCVICGDVGYNLSCGGPSICPKCDCGNFDAATVMKQAKALAALQARVEHLEAQLADSCDNTRFEDFDAGCPRAFKAEARVEELTKALTAILDENDEFRKAMPADWEGDPLEDACAAARLTLGISLDKEGTAA